MGKIISLFCLMVLCLTTNAREVYCSINKEKDNTYQIIPNKEYLNDGYWDFITKDGKGNITKFNTLQDAITRLSRFGWRVVKGQNTNDKGDSILMEHDVESIYELKSSREELINLF